MKKENKIKQNDEGDEKEKEEFAENGEIVKREEVLVFHKDEKGNNVARLPNGKIVLHHRKDTVEIIEGLEYNCLLEEKPHWCFAWIKGLIYYPRIVLKSDRTCIGMENNKTRKLYPDVYKAVADLKAKTKKNYVLLITNEETKEDSW